MGAKDMPVVMKRFLTKKIKWIFGSEKNSK